MLTPISAASNPTRSHDLVHDGSPARPRGSFAPTGLQPSRAQRGDACLPACLYLGSLVATVTSQLNSIMLPANLHVNSVSHSPRSEKKRWRWSVIKSRLTESRAMDGEKTPAILVKHCDATPIRAQRAQARRDSDCKRREVAFRAHSQLLLHYQLLIINVLHMVWFSVPYSIMLCRHHSKWGPHGKAGGALGFLGSLSPLLWNAVAVLLLVAVIALTFDGLLLR